MRDGPSAKKMLQTKCDLIMIGRKAIGYPRIFLEINKFLEKQPFAPIERTEYMEIVQDFLKLLIETYPDGDFKFYKERVNQFIRPKICGKNIKLKLQNVNSMAELEEIFQ